MIYPKGEKDLHTVLREFWDPFSATNQDVVAMKTPDVLDVIGKKMESFLFPESEESGDKGKSCPQCKEGTLGLKVGRF